MSLVFTFVLLFGLWIIPASALICYNCEDRVDGSLQCNYLQSKESATEICPAKTSGCFEQISNGRPWVRQRGCFYGENCHAASARCRICHSDLCNSKQHTVESCQTDYFSEVVCTKSTFQRGGCFSWTRPEDNHTEKSCVTSLTDERMDQCAKDVECRICNGNFCNWRSINSMISSVNQNK